MRIFRSALCGLLLLYSALAAAAHEVRPAIGDLETGPETVRLTVDLSAEAILAGADLEGVQDTNALSQNAEIDTLRQLEPADLAARVRSDAARIAAAVEIAAAGAAIPLEITAIEPGAVGNVELPRDTRVRFEGPLPEGAEALTVTWPAEWGTLVLRQQGVEAPFTGYLSGGTPSEPIALGGGSAAGVWSTFASYIPVGFEHIVPLGLDHILFVLGLFFLSPALKPLLWQVTAFTAAHTVTLALAGLGVVSVPASVVEPLIAASIVFIAVENIVSRGLSPWRPAIVFGFGLLHGLGFASVLGEFGLPEGRVVPALLGFNVGVEIGQLFVIALAFLLVYMALRVDRLRSTVERGMLVYGVLTVVFLACAWLLDGAAFQSVMEAGAPIFFVPLAALSALCLLSCVNVDKLDSYRSFVAVPASAAIGAVGLWWVVERVFL